MEQSFYVMHSSRECYPHSQIMLRVSNPNNKLINKQISKTICDNATMSKVENIHKQTRCFPETDHNIGWLFL